MATVIGDATTRKASQSILKWTLLQKDGITALDLSAATNVKLKLTNKDDSTDITLIDATVTDATNGKVQIIPTLTTFTISKTFLIHFQMNLDSRFVTIPDDRDYFLTIIN